MYYAHVNPRFMQNNQPITKGASCLLHDFQREQLKSSLITHKIIQQFYIVWPFPVLCHGNNPTLEYKNKKFPFEGPARQTLNFVCSLYIYTHYVSYINSTFFNFFWQFNCWIFNSSTSVYLGQTDHSGWPWS